jgi:hypothetical protein
MPAHYFTLEEANALLPEIKPMVSQLLERRAKIVSARKEIIELLRSARSDIGGREASELVQDFIFIEKLGKKVRSYGVILKDLNVGLVDFLSLRDGREVYLCWRYGEPEVQFYHELHGGFAGREHI